MHMLNFSIIIPIYNEKNNIFDLIDEIKKSLLNNDNEYEIIIVDDASSDLSNYHLNQLNNQKNCRLIRNTTNIGQSRSLLKGIKNSQFETIITLDGDGQNDPQDINLLLNKYFSEIDLYLVGGIRKNRKDSLVKILSSRIANSIRDFILKDGCRDTGCALKVFDKNVFLTFPFFDGIHRFLPALFAGYSKKTFFLDVNHRPRKYGVSKYGTFKRLFRGINDLIKVSKIINRFKRSND